MKTRGPAILQRSMKTAPQIAQVRRDEAGLCQAQVQEWLWGTQLSSGEL